MGWPLVGRGEELAVAGRALDGCGLVIAGPTGVGKTRLASEVVEVAARRGWVTAWAGATAAAQAIPFGAMAHLLPATLDRVLTRANLLRAAADALVGQLDGKARHLVVGVDDAHLLDGHSAALIQLVATSGRALVVAAVRSGETCPDAITALWKDGLCPRLELGPLSEGEVGRLLEAVLGGPVAVATLHRLWGLCAGNPLFLHEVVAGGLERGALTAEGGMWTWRGPLWSPHLTGMIAARLAALSGDQQRALEVIAVAEPVEVGFLDNLAEAEALEALQRAGLVTETTSGRRRMARLAHPMYAELARASLPPAALRRLCARLATAVETTGARRRGDLLRLASWRLDAGAGIDAAQLTAAARRAAGVLDYALAERLARAASDAGGGCDADYVLALALSAQGRAQEADALLARLAAEAGDDARRMQAAASRAYNVAWGLNDRVGATVGELAQTEEGVSDPDARAEVASTRGLLMVLLGQLAEASAISRAVLAREGASDLARVQALTATLLVLFKTGRLRQADTLLARHGEWLTQALVSFPYGVVQADVCRFLSGFYGGRFREVGDDFERRYRAALGRQAPGWVTGNLAGMTGVFRRVEGRPDTAVRWLREGYLQLNDSGDLLGFLGVGLAETAHSLALAGDLAAAEAALAEFEAAQVPAFRAIAGFGAEARVWVSVARGEISAAVTLALDQAAELGALDLLVPQAGLLHQATRLDAADRAHGPLTRLAEVCDSPLVAAQAAHTVALVGADAPGLLAVSGRFAHMGALVYAAEAAAQAARLHRRAGAKGSALTAAARARALLGCCERLHTPALADLDAPLPLTRREREVATLAARGLANPQIAERLVISARTVDNHLHHAYAKLGIAGRDDLAAILLADVPVSPTTVPRSLPGSAQATDQSPGQAQSTRGSVLSEAGHA